MKLSGQVILIAVGVIITVWALSNITRKDTVVHPPAHRTAKLLGWDESDIDRARRILEARYNGSCKEGRIEQMLHHLTTEMMTPEEFNELLKSGKVHRDYLKGANCLCHNDDPSKCSY